MQKMNYSQKQEFSKTIEKKKLENSRSLDCGWEL
jgi:hypothetical protein